MLDYQDVRRRDVTVWLGAEGMQETEGQAWRRDATSQETIDLATERGGTVEEFAAMKLDHTGRPYWLVTITRQAPVEVWLHCSSHLRVVHAYP